MEHSGTSGMKLHFSLRNFKDKKIKCQCPLIYLVFNKYSDRSMEMLLNIQPTNPKTDMRVVIGGIKEINSFYSSPAISLFSIHIILFKFLMRSISINDFPLLTNRPILFLLL